MSEKTKTALAQSTRIFSNQKPRSAFNLQHQSRLSLLGIAMVSFLATQSMASVQQTLDTITEHNLKPSYTSATDIHIMQLSRSLTKGISAIDEKADGTERLKTIESLKKLTLQDQIDIKKVALIIKESDLATDLESIRQHHQTNYVARLNQFRFQQKIENLLSVLNGGDTLNLKATAMNSSNKQKSEQISEQKGLSQNGISEEDAIIFGLQTLAAIKAQQHQDPKTTLQSLRHLEKGSALKFKIEEDAHIFKSAIFGTDLLNTLTHSVKVKKSPTNIALSFVEKFKISVNRSLHQMDIESSKAKLVSLGIPHDTHDKLKVVSLSLFVGFLALGTTSIYILGAGSNLLEQILIYSAVTFLLSHGVASLLAQFNKKPSLTEPNDDNNDTPQSPPLSRTDSSSIKTASELKDILSSSLSSLDAQYPDSEFDLNSIAPAIINLHVGQRFLSVLDGITVSQVEESVVELQQEFSAKKWLSHKFNLDTARAFFFALAGLTPETKLSDNNLRNRDILAFDSASIKSHLTYLAPGSLIYAVLSDDNERSLIEKLSAENPGKIKILESSNLQFIQHINANPNIKNAWTQQLNLDSLGVFLEMLTRTQHLTTSNLTILVPQGTAIAFDQMSSETKLLLEGVMWMVGNISVQTTLLNKIEVLAQALVQA